MRTHTGILLAGLLLVAGAGCNDFLTGGELSEDPNRPSIATNRQLFVGVQTNLWAMQASDPARVASVLTQQLRGTQGQYFSLDQYSINEQTTNGFNAAVYAGGGLRDVRQLEANALEQGDSLFLGIAQIQEAMLMGIAASLFGDVVYSQALGEPNPPLDPQLEVYDAVQALLTSAIELLSSFSDPNVNLGPAVADLNYGGDPERWIRLANTLRARFYLHTAEVRPAAYAQALAAARDGITDPADDWKAIFSGGANETNFWYQFMLEQRFLYLVGHPQFLALLEQRDDPRRDEYFDESGDFLQGTGEGDTDRLDPGYDQPLVTAAENLLIWAEAAHRTGAEGEARTQLNRARAIAGLGPVAGGLSGNALLVEILTEKYIATFQTLEAWNDYKRTCFPNLTPTVASLKIPARLPYDTNERQTNTNIPAAEDQPTRNANDPPNATSDGTGQACRGQ